MKKAFKRNSISSPLGETPKAEKYLHILVIRLSAMGDVAMCVPVLRRLVKQYPNLKITVLTKAFFTPFFDDISNVEVLVADVKNEHKGFFGLAKLAFQLRKNNFDAVADLHHVLRTKILRFFFFFFGIKWKTIDKGRAEKKELTRLEPKIIQPLKTTHQRYAEVFSSLGFPVDLTQKVEVPNYPIPKKAQEILGKTPRKWVGIAPFAAHEAKMYPLDLMEKVIAEIDKSEAYEIILFGGGKKETEILNNLASKYKNVENLAGKLSFKEELHVISNLDAMISMDSGNGHMAALFQIPVITIWGATHPFAGFAPFQQPQENQLLPDLKKYPLLPTSIYGNKKVEGYHEVMRSINPQQIVHQLKKIA
ncbi:glycosyltransferase family 9 protein [Mesonia maritima]|uniref:ADP-heptose:LPS heptosyltransferase n=1 Tax=Mesonia maritima TaxID=1793873 RepID=A0ABU1K3J4_9FLAO|nr:glycosyltransferase family 9 protein [Mesonia maritima]MDR6299830.1 ADP-heptose:LPS heptosyltransferase [Mesonia maritima]